MEGFSTISTSMSERYPRGVPEIVSQRRGKAYPAAKQSDNEFLGGKHYERRGAARSLVGDRLAWSVRGATGGLSAAASLAEDGMAAGTARAPARPRRRSWLAGGNALAGQHRTAGRVQPAPQPVVSPPRAWAGSQPAQGADEANAATGAHRSGSGRADVR